MTLLREVNALGLKDPARYSADILDRLRRLEAERLLYLEERLRDKQLLTEEEIPHAVREFKRFIALVILNVRPLGMINPKVDEVWHQFILFTRQYAEFCERVVGHYVHHQPRTSLTPLPRGGKASFIRAYRHHFGELPDIWNVSADMNCNTDDDETPSGWGDSNPSDDCSPTG